MFARIIENCRLRKEYSNNHLRPFDGTLLEELRVFEATAGSDYFDAFSRIRMKKGEFLLKEEETCTHLWFIEEGFARQFVCSDKEEFTIDFYFPSEFVSFRSSYILKKPCLINIQLLTNAIVYCISWDELNKLKLKYPVLIKFEEITFACFYESMARRMIDYLTLISAERYKKLINDHPYMIHYMKLIQVASYLGITEETLSRIRAKLKSK